MFKKIFEYAGPYKKNMYVATVVVLVSVLMGILPFVLAYQVISPLVMGDSVETEFVLLRVIGVLICLVLQAFFYGWGLSISHKAAYNTLFRLRVSLQKKFEKLPLGIVEEKGTGTIKKLFVDDVDSLELLLAHSVPEGIANSVGMKRMGPYYQSAQKMNNTIIEYINGMEVVKVFNKDADSYERFRKDVSDYRDYTLAWYKAAWPWMAIYSSLLPCTIILTLPVGAWFVLSGWSTLPNLILVLCLSLSIGMPLLKSLGFLPTMPQLNYKISALEQVLDAPELQQTEDAFHGKDDTITYDHVSFAYQTTQPGPDGKPVVIEDEVLHDISFTAKAGQKTALVGESGSGKSTLAKLLIHYYDPQKGSISIGGQKLCDMSLEALNSRISYVAQDQYLFNTSLLENIRLGRLNATDEEVVEAAKKAQCMEFLEKLPQGIHSMAGDAGKMLSGGQHQRISLARAILKDAPIVVLDEATAYADPENEEKMEAAIAELVKGKTLVVIAHKLPAIMNADQICVMDHGKLVATGKHQELIQSCPEYQKLWKAAQDSAEWKVHTAKEGK
ncbi:MAG: ABC transporter ATP-binding protein [Eubacterium sp.]|nr:ABC transporter ATP-binding protein [Eubacterium sp.]